MGIWVVITAYSLITFSMVSTMWKVELIGPAQYRGPLNTSFDSPLKASTAYGALAGLSCFSLLSGAVVLSKN